MADRIVLSSQETSGWYLSRNQQSEEHGTKTLHLSSKKDAALTLKSELPPPSPTPPFKLPMAWHHENSRKDSTLSVSLSP